MSALLIIVAGIIVYVWMCTNMTKLGEGLQKLGNALIEYACSMREYQKYRMDAPPSEETQKLSDRIDAINPEDSDDYQKRVREEIERITEVQ